MPFKNHLGLLHYLRLICTDPRRHGLDVFKPDKLSDYRVRAPKLDWLLTQLKAIEGKGEKVIVFCEFRNIQRLLQHYVHEALGLKPDIINGDTAASASHTQSRQKRIRAFQERPGFAVIILSPLAVGFGVLMMAVLIGHIYMGTIGMRGAFAAMRSGYVSHGWAKEHHALWHDDILAGKIAAKRSTESPPALGSAPRQA